MPSISVTVPHRLPQEEALKRVKAFIERAKAQQAEHVTEMKEEWNGNVGTFHLSAKGFSGSGTVTVNPSEVTLETTVPLIAMPFKGAIESGVREQLTRLLA